MAESRVERFVASWRKRTAEDAAAAMLAVSPPPANSRRAATNPAELFDPAALAKLGKLELISQTVVDGFLSGKHRSTHKGGFTEFAEYRNYTAGDDLRQLDWRLFARSDRYYVRQYDDETNLQALLILDCSGSMRFGLSTPPKWQYARMAAACLSRLLLRQRDSVGLALVTDQLRHYVRPMSRANHLARCFDLLASTDAGGPSPNEAALAAMADRLGRRGMVLYFSDCFGDIDQTSAALQQFRLRGHDVTVFQILAPEEVTFPFRRPSFFQDLELPRRLEAQPAQIRRRYLELFRDRQQTLTEALARADVDLETLTTDRDLGETLALYLRKRAARRPGRPAP